MAWVYTRIKNLRAKPIFLNIPLITGFGSIVPSDWNSQMPELKYYEGTIWYGKALDLKRRDDKRQFLSFGAVSYRCRVFLNGKQIGSHEGGFTPFLVEITDQIKATGNFLVVEVNNRRSKDAIPAMAFDWWNYGGITRDVLLVTTPKTFISDYVVQLNKFKSNQIDAQVQLSEKLANAGIQIEIPELKINVKTTTDQQGMAKVSIPVRKLERWSPELPRLYQVIVSSENDRVEERIGFRNLYVKGTEIYLNDKPIFLKGINFHEEIAQRKGRAYSEADAAMLLSEAKALGANMIRLAHYPQNEYTVRLAEKMGFILWQEIPVWQGIDFKNMETREKAKAMLQDMITRDRNRCAVGFWSVGNETRPSEDRNNFLAYMLEAGRQLDGTRLFTAASDMPRFDKDSQTFVMNDPITSQLDVVAVNKYMGWYHPWPVAPEKAVWNVAPDKPLLFSEFGGEALYGQAGDSTVASSWSEDYQEKLYKDNLIMFRHITNLRGICPWALFDFRSPSRMHQANQDGWNRKGLVSDQGFRKKAWYVIHDFYMKTK